MGLASPNPTSAGPRAPGRAPSRAPSRAPVVVTQGDPTGIGPELLLRLAAQGVFGDGDRIVADPAVLQARAEALDASWADEGARALAPHLEALGEGVAWPSDPSREPGRSQVAALERGVDLVLAACRTDSASHDAPAPALVTAPIDKHLCRSAGFAHMGHTEYLAARAGGAEAAMFLVGDRLRVGLATIHVPLHTVAARLDAAAIVHVGGLIVDALRSDFGCARPRLAVLGLNPHAGESGELGREEEEVVAPAVAELARLHADEATIEGPLPADTAFFHHAQGRFDAVLAMYHDQGLGPFKLVHFTDGVNVTLGLPFVRTSPDHGTARDLVGTGRADAGSMRAAVALARSMASRRARGEREG